jgi:hypothetical protein
MYVSPILRRKESTLEKKKRYIIKRISKSKYFALYLYMLLVLFLSCSVASYAWFTLNRSPLVSNMNMYVTTSAGLELSNDPGAEEWTTYLDIYSTEELKQFAGDDTPKPALQQVSWSDQEGRFYAPFYGHDGRLMKVLSWFPLNDEEHASKAEDNYYIKTTFYARSGQTTTVRLTEPKDRKEGVPGSGTFVRGFPDHTGKGPEVAIRLGMRMTYVDRNGKPVENSEPGPMFIYEPNSNVHADGLLEGYSPTYSIHQPDENNPIQELVPLDEVEKRVIIQEYSLSEEETGVFVNNPDLFTIYPGQIVKIELYVWLEGQDVDCSNVMDVRPEGLDISSLDPTDPRLEYYTGNYRQIRAHLQFTGTDEEQTGLKPIG